MMNTRVCLGLALCGLLAGVSTGCSSTPIVARGQNALPEPFVVPAGYGSQPELRDVVHDTVHNTRIDYYNVPANNPHQPVPANWHLPAHMTGLHGTSPAQACPPGGACPQCPPSADCPHCKGHPGNEACPFCQNSASGVGGHVHGLMGGAYNHLRGPYPKHHFTYAYKRPHNLQYPPPQVPGGVVVYPYYTLKGPSDFFRP